MDATDTVTNQAMASLLPLSAVIPTRNRPRALACTLESLVAQSVQPKEVIVIDASEDGDSKAVVEQKAQTATRDSTFIWQKALTAGAAVQRTQGVAATQQPFILFCDDDVLFEPACLERLWNAINVDPKMGGASAMIVNQKYHPPGLVSRIMFALMNGHSESTFAGRVIGPAINLLPEDSDKLPEVVPVDWLNLGCTIYRREALPKPLFESVFSGYSLSEDLALSLLVGRNWKLANIRTSRIFHDSQPGLHKADQRALAAMALVNRYYVMTNILERRRLMDYLKFIAWELFQLIVLLEHASTWNNIPARIKGLIDGVRRLQA